MALQKKKKKGRILNTSCQEKCNRKGVGMVKLLNCLKCDIKNIEKLATILLTSKIKWTEENQV